MARRALGVVALGVVLGFLGSRLLFLQWATLIPWGVAALAVGGISDDRRQALVSGTAYGFALGFSFMAAGYSGADPLLGKVPFFAIIGVISAVFGMAGGIAGQWLVARRRRLSGGGSR